jgi:DNA helicase-2/ATP-dependent DNA helicase PcrA
MTLHASKGLEFACVFVTGLEEGLFPLARSLDDPKDLEEERRLFYVGVTRAEKRLFLLMARSRFRFGEQQPGIASRFLDEVEGEIERADSGRPAKGNRFSSARPGFAGGGIKERGWVEYESLDPEYFKAALRRPTPPREGAARRASTEGRQVVFDEGEGGEIRPGMLVEHDQFGPGRVLSIDGSGQHAKAAVEFDDFGPKKLVLRFARLRVIE